jgi:molybdopterin synthase catalytic subunit
MRRAAIVSREIDPAAVLATVQSKRFGAISMFVGTVRDVNDGRAVSSIEYSAYVSMAEAEMEKILAESEERFGVGAIAVEHRVGSLSLGEVSIAIAAAHEHRRPALDATSFVIEEIKTRVPIWKLEHYAEGASEWVNPTNQTEIAHP